MKQQLFIGSDHGGYELKTALVNYLSKKNIETEDLGTYNATESVDYPSFAESIASKVISTQNSLGILVCGTGIGMSIAANKIPKIRAALCHNTYTAEMSKRHNNANILVLGGRILSEEDGIVILEKWLQTPFDGDRHQRRLDQITSIEQK